MNRDAKFERLPEWLEHAWLARYLDRKLAAEESEWFEAYALGRPELLDAIELDNELRDALAAGAASMSQTEPTREETVAPARAARTRRWIVPIAWAASLALAVMIGASRAPQPTGSAAIAGSPTRVVFDAVRGEATQSHVERGDPGTRMLVIEVGVPEDAADIRIELGGHRSSPLVRSGEGYVSIVVDRARADAKRAELTYELEGSRRQQSLDLSGF